MRIGLMAFDGKGLVVLFNTAAEHILGHRARDVVGKPGEEIFDGLADIVSGASGQRSAAGADHELKGNARHKDGRLVPLAITAHPRPCESGHSATNGIIIVFQDARQLEKMEKQLQHMDRLRSLDEFAAGIVHEIRNPLAGISINAQHLAEEIGKRCRKSCARIGRPSRFAEEMQDILADVQSIESIVKKVLDFAHPNKPQVLACSVSDVVKEALRFSRMPLQRQGIRLVTDLRVTDKVRVDVSQMKQVLFNILRNARDAMPEGGELRVSTRRGTVPSKKTGSRAGNGTISSNESDLRARNGTIRSTKSDLHASTPTSCGHVYVEVEDTGRGIAKQYLERIFDPFFTMQREGSGLGLAISRKIVENHGGTIEVASELGKGTTFAVVLPTV